MKKIIIFTLFSALIISCSNNKEKEISKIKDLEKATLSSNTVSIDYNKAKELVDAYINFVKNYSKDSACANYLFKAANISMNIGKAQLSVELFDQIIKDYSGFNKVADCMFMKAFVYDDKLKNINKAREAYKAFLNKYPSNEFADDAQACLDNLGKTPEQLIKEFEAKQKKDSLSLKK